MAEIQGSVQRPVERWGRYTIRTWRETLTYNAYIPPRLESLSMDLSLGLAQLLAEAERSLRDLQAGRRARDEPGRLQARRSEDDPRSPGGVRGRAGRTRRGALGSDLDRWQGRLAARRRLHPSAARGSVGAPARSVRVHQSNRPAGAAPGRDRARAVRGDPSVPGRKRTGGSMPGPRGSPPSGADAAIPAACQRGPGEQRYRLRRGAPRLPGAPRPGLVPPLREVHAHRGAPRH